ncbi:MAG TPA: serine hydrolase domain-containing protein [Hyphomonadaceae bacterium]
MTSIVTRLLAATAIGAALVAAACTTTLDDMTGTALHPQSIEANKLGMPTATPESQGFTTAGLEALKAEFRGLVDQQKLAGVTTLVARHGKVVHFDTYGKANAATGEELKPDSIFRIASMTKPITGVAMMQLYEQGKWKMDDPVAMYIPEFADLKVKKAGGGTEPQNSPMTMAQLMSHSAGFGVSAVYNEANLGATDLQGMIDKLKNLPLETQPGTAWDYGPSVNIQGYIVEKLSGQSLDVYFDEHIFKPLGMVDTGFWMPPEKSARVVAVHTYDSAGKIQGPSQNRVTTAKPSFLAGSGGLMSTAEDYWRFAQAMGNGGQLNGKRILKEETVKLMRVNVLKPGVKVDLYGPSQEGVGFGMDFAIIMDPARAGTPQGLNSFYWGGAFGTWFWIDPTNDLVFVGMIQNQNGSTPTGGTPPTRTISPRLTYAALAQPQK